MNQGNPGNRRAAAAPGLWAESFKATVPVMFGYLTLGIAFGLLATDSGFPWWMVLSMSVFMYAGAGQFALVGLLGSGGGVAEAALLAFAVNVRHVAYGVSMIKRFAPWPRRKTYLALALTDETFALLSTLPPKGASDGPFMTRVAFLDQSWWVIGSMIGALAGALLPWKLEGLDFALTSLFVVLLVEQCLRVREALPYIGAIAGTLLGIAAAGPRSGIVIGLAIGIAASGFASARAEKRPGDRANR